MEGNVIMKMYHNDGKNRGLQVNGIIQAREMEIVDNDWWVIPDYVFEKDYKLMPLKDLEQYIDTAKHLPNVQSRKEIEEKGNISIPDMNFKMMEKIEELTLYMFQLKKENDAIKTQNEELKTRVEALEKTN